MKVKTILLITVSMVVVTAWYYFQAPISTQHDLPWSTSGEAAGAIMEGPIGMYKTCSGGKPSRDVVYVAIQKTASTTLRTMFHRYALEHKLPTCIDSHDRRHLNWPNKIDPAFVLKPSNQKCSMIADEMVYDKEILDGLTNPGRKYVTSVRDPVRHFVSAFQSINMYVILRAISSGPLSHHDAMRLYFRDPTAAALAFEAHVSRRMGFRYDLQLLRPNLQLYDLGIPSPELMGDEELVRVIRSTLKDFSAVVIAGDFDESLILLKEALCWEYEDLFYKTLNTQGGQHKFQRALPDDINALIAHDNRYDMILYNIVKKEFQATLSQRHDVDKEIAHMQNIRSEAETKCKLNKECIPFDAQKLHESIERQAKLSVKRYLESRLGNVTL